MPRRFHPAVREWFEATFAAPTAAQSRGWPAIQAGESTLLLAPTGSGKTLAAFLSAIDRLMFEPGDGPAPTSAKPRGAQRGARAPAEGAGCRVVYVSPLKALAVDVERNLRTPLAGIAEVAARRGDVAHLPTIAIRSGDTPADERRLMARHPPEILITTPESLFLILTSEARHILRDVETVIVDEIHALAGTKRGTHLALSLERLEELRGRPLQRLGLSATFRPLDVVARFLGGYSAPDTPRAVHVVDAGVRRALELTVEVPRPDEAAPSAERRSIWPAIHPRLLELIRTHRSTLIFVNSRRLAERLAAALNELAGEELVRAHHGSLAHDERRRVEEALKAGQLPALVATSSLELGIDMGAIDLVVQIEAPPSVAHGLQRIGRSGHRTDATARGILMPKFRGDLLATAASTRSMLDGAVEETRLVENALDVLAQQLVAAASIAERHVDDLYALVRRSAPFAGLTRDVFDGVLDMLAGRYPADEFADLRPRLVWDRRHGLVRAREGARRVVIANAGTIPDRGLYGVFLAPGADAAGAARRGGLRVGELDEEMVFESKVGEVIVLGASSWRIVEIERERVLVTPAPGVPGKIPFWHGDRPARPVDAGRSIGRLTRRLGSLARDEAAARLVEHHCLTPDAAEMLLGYLADQRQATGVVPDDHTLVLERTRDELGDWRLCLLSPLGGRVHAPWALAIEAQLRRLGRGDVDTLWSDDGIVVHLPDRDDPPQALELIPDPEEIEELVVSALGGSALFAAHFREAASRALLLPRRRPGQRTPLWMQRRRAGDLLAIAARHPSFPIILEAYRECLKDVFDVPGLVDLAGRVQRRELRLVTVDTETPSPFAASLLFGYVANYIYDGDAPLAERRAQALAVDRRQLRELLGEAELRELLDPEVLAEIEAHLLALSPAHVLRSADDLADLLRRLGPLTIEEVATRAEIGIGEVNAQRAEARDRARHWSTTLAREGRAFLVGLGNTTRLAAAEDAGRLRDACGAEVPDGLAIVFLESVPRALEELVARHARTHGPFAARDVAARYGLDEARVLTALYALAAAGRVLEGELRPGGSGREWCDTEVLARLRQASLARWRRQVEPSDPSALARLLVVWHGVSREIRHEVTDADANGVAPELLLESIERLQGVAVPASALESDLLPARVPGYHPAHLDALTAAGEVVWVGRGRLGEHDGRVALYLAEDLPLLHPPGDEPPRSSLHDTLRATLARRGASFFHELHGAAGGEPLTSVLEALWDLVWSGEVTNDSLAALRAQRLAGQLLARRQGRRLRAYRSRLDVPATAVGRWALVPPPSGSPTERLTRLAEQLILRHGLLTREAVRAEGLSGGFAALYPVLAAMEQQGLVRRGYFVAGLGGAQFADPGAVERLRLLTQGPVDTRAVVLAATDPANAFGATLPWPQATESRLARTPGAHVVLFGGRLLVFVERDERDLVVFLSESDPERVAEAHAAAEALAAWALRSGHFLLGWAPTTETPAWVPALRSHLLAAGYVPTGRGFRLRGRPEPTDVA